MMVSKKQIVFRTPTLRYLHYTTPYMHNGTMLSLEKVLEFYENSKKVEINKLPYIKLIR